MTAYQDVVNSFGPRAFWPLDDTSGTVAREIADSAPGTYTGTFTLNQSGPATGIASVLLNGGYVSCPQVVDWGGPLATVALWFKLSAAQAADAIIWSVGLAVTNGFNLQRDIADGRLYFGEPNVARYSVGAVINDNSWHHLVVVSRAAAVVDFYMDGGLRATIAPAASITSTTALTIGAASNGTSPMKGNYADFAVMRYPITAADVNGLLVSTNPALVPLPATYAQLVTTLADLTDILNAVRRTYS